VSEAAAAQQATEGAARGNAAADAAEQQQHQREGRGAPVAVRGRRGPRAPRAPAEQGPAVATAGGRRIPPAPRSTAKGWSAFTLFGLEARSAVRAENPQASAADIEKVWRRHVLLPVLNL